jgi:Glucose / Sorbosone dehydrogenase
MLQSANQTRQGVYIARSAVPALLSLFFAVVALAEPRIQGDASWKRDWQVAENFSISIDAEEFRFPSAIAFVPNPGNDPKDPLYFVTELRGKIKVVANDRTVSIFAEDFFKLDPPEELPSIEGEMGMAGIVLDPEHGYVFVSFIYQDAKGILRNNIVRFQSKPRTFSLKPSSSVAFTDVFDGYPSRVAHQIGPMVIKDGLLYVSVGEAGRAFDSQNLDSILGKILRMTLDGEPVRDNPFYESNDVNRARNYVWASGLRNAFGLIFVHGRLFVADNGLNTDRFIEIERGGNYGWDGTNLSINTNALVIFGPAVAPVQLAWLPKGGSQFPRQYQQKFFLALAGGESPGPGSKGSKAIVTLSYDFKSGKMADRPRYFLKYRGDNYQLPVGTAFGPDGLYVVPLYPVRSGKGAILRIRYAPENAHPFVIGGNEQAYELMVSKGCFNCHGERTVDVNVGPPLDPETLIPRLIKTLESTDYAKKVSEINRVDSEFSRSFREPREQVMAVTGIERARLWIKYRLMEPMFDRQSSAMPNLGLSEPEASRIADYLVSRNEGHVAEGLADRLLEIFRKFIPKPKYRQIPISIALGFFAAVALFGVVRLVQRRAVRRKMGPRE